MSTETGSALLLTSVTNFFQKSREHRDTLYNIIEGKSAVSLRLLDFFITNYSRHHNVIYWIDDKGSGGGGGYMSEVPMPTLRKFHLYFEYRAQLKSFSKASFDIFRRHERLTFVLESAPELKTVETTLGQLNAMRWILHNRVIDYIQAHLAEIQQEMTVAQKVSKAKPPEAKRSGGGSHKDPSALVAQSRSVMHAPCQIRFD